MANTTNFGWETPDDTDLVKDGAAAIRTLGSAIDTSLVDLKGGTTGQVLAKASDTDMDFTWATDASGIPATIFDAKGDLIAASAADTAARLAVGTDGQILTADSTQSTGLRWVSPAAASSPNNASALTVGAQSTTSTSFTGLSTATAVTVTTGTKALVMITVQLANNTLNEQTWASYAISGASSISASENWSIYEENPSTGTLPRYTTATRAYIHTGLTAGSNTFTLQYKVGGGTGSFGYRSISVVDMGS